MASASARLPGLTRVCAHHRLPTGAVCAERGPAADGERGQVSAVCAAVGQEGRVCGEQGELGVLLPAVLPCLALPCCQRQSMPLCHHRRPRRCGAPVLSFTAPLLPAACCVAPVLLFTAPLLSWLLPAACPRHADRHPELGSGGVRGCVLCAQQRGAGAGRRRSPSAARQVKLCGTVPCAVLCCAVLYV